MSEAAIQTPTGAGSDHSGAGDTDIRDPQADLKKELMEANQRQFEMMQKSLEATTRGIMAAQEEKLASLNKQPELDYTNTDPSTNPVLSEFKDEMDRIGLDNEQAVGLMSMINKLMGKQADGFKEEIHQERDSKLAFSSKKSEAEKEVSSQYPDVLDHSSTLFRESQNVYQELKSNNDPIIQSPMATAYAIREAASRLGISPLTRESIKQRDAFGPHGGSGEAPKKEEFSEKSSEFGLLFGVNPEKMKEKLHETNVAHKRVPA